MNGARPNLVRGSMMVATSLTIAGVVSLLTSIVIAQSVSVSEFGFYSMTISLQTVVTLFSSFGVGLAVAKYVAEYRIRDVKHAIKFARSGLRLVLLFSTVTTVVYFALADPIGNGLYGEARVADLIPFSAMVAFSSAVLALSSGVAQGYYRMRLMSSMQVSTPIISLSIIVAFIPCVGIRIAFMGMFIGQSIVALSAMYWLSRTSSPLGSRFDSGANLHHSRLLLTFAVPAVISTIMIAPVYWFGNTMLALESGFLSVGHFAVAMVFFQALSLLPSSLVIPLIPRISEMSVHFRERIEYLVSRSLRAMSVLFFPLFFAIALFSEDIVAILYGMEYSDSGEVVYLMVVACYYFAMATTVGAAVAGLGRMWVSLGLNMTWAAVFVPMTLVAVPLYGPNGLGLAYAVSYGFYLAVSMIVSKKVLSIRIMNVHVTIVSSIVFFSAGFSLMIGVDELSMLVKVVLLAAGSGLMVSLGRAEFRMVFETLSRRGHGSM